MIDARVVPGITRRGLFASGASLLATPGSSRRPNILLIVADQLRGDCVAADGNPATASRIVKPQRTVVARRLPQTDTQ